MTYKTKI